MPFFLFIWHLIFPSDINDNQLSIRVKMLDPPYFNPEQGLATNRFVASLLQPTTWKLIRPSTCII
jgi:hypothetical protein